MVHMFNFLFNNNKKHKKPDVSTGHFVFYIKITFLQAYEQK